MTVCVNVYVLDLLFLNLLIKLKNIVLIYIKSFNTPIHHLNVFVFAVTKKIILKFLIINLFVV